VIHGRLRPLLALFVLLGALLVARLYQVQVREHVIWASEAARLVRKGREVPYRRGRILDATGRVLAHDEESQRVVLVYRDFRREHPLGQVAHARSLVLGRPVPLGEVAPELAEHARVLLALTPPDLAALARGADGPRAIRELEPRLRARRAADLAFYLRGILGLGPSRDPSTQRQRLAVWRQVLALAGVEGERRSFLELAARARYPDDPAALAREERALDERLAQSEKQLRRLARWLLPAGADTADPTPQFVAELEEARAAIEDLTAAKLFAEAAGFAPGRVEVDTLLECFDLGWIRALLGWDAERLAQWAARVRAGWQTKWRDGECLPQLFWSLAQDPSAEPGPHDFLSRLAVVYRPEGALAEALEEGPRSWREVDELAVFSALDELFVADVPASARALGESALAFQLPELRADPDEARLLPEGTGPGSFRALLARAQSARGRNEVAELLALSARLNEIWELRFQETLRAALDETRRAARRSELAPEGGLRLTAASRDRAAERAEFFLKDFGSRPRALSKGEFPWDVTYLLTRYERDFPGFRVDDSGARARVELAAEDAHPAEFLVGTVSAPLLDDVLRQRRTSARLRELKNDPERGSDEAEELLRLIGEVRLPSEVKGVAGIEAFLDPELRGTNGFDETRGAGDLFGREAERLTVVERIDGLDVELTLDAGLQAAAQRSLRTPEVLDDPSFDHAWQRAPVGAIVLLSRAGDVLAAASEPDDQSPIGPDASGERRFRAERTLTKRTFQPPGSTFKVFVAAWALAHGLDPTRQVTCAPLEGGGAGYKDLRCSSRTGHGPVDLHAALVQSCNAYFAWLGETLSTDELGELCARFGFGEPTGVRRAPFGDGRRRAGLREDRAGPSLPKDGGEWSASLRRRAANGLSVIEATPMQVARATLGLALGELSELCLVRAVGGREELPPLPRALELDARSLDFVRAAMRGVADEPNGTAHAALAREQLGFAVAVKTGSADLESRPDGEGHVVVRKHAWVAGWAPADEPELVFVVFEHDTTATSSHGAVYLARQLLRQPEVRAWLEARGVATGEVGAR
jgi:cell division protein FtsI/penicillin-binding protein 2